ncbi:MAG TPA: excinuclease ABC subunit UvrC [Chthoniobacteraceae bacterium]|nr:excinuclease ABC subunit UvrC [Chthoniobacteraceae bacterium]
MTREHLKDKPDLRPKLHDLPHKPGVYLMRDRLHRVIYVGKARDLRKRVSQYFMASKQRSADLKTRALLESVWDLEWHTVRSEPEALLLEGRLIKEFRPRYNISFRDDKRFLMVKVDMAEEWPRFRFARIKKEDQARYFGPFAQSGALRQTLHFMRKRFGILTFGRGAPSERELKSSTFQVLAKMSGFSTEAYRQRVEEACAFLGGESRELLVELEAEMKKAAEKLDFERAAELRNMLENLKTTTRPMRRFTRHTLPTTIDPQADLALLSDALGLERPPEVMECFDISNISSTHIVASMVSFRNGVPDKANYRRFRMKTVAAQDDFASMAEVVRRRYERILLEARKKELEAGDEESQEEVAARVARRGGRLPDLVIVDGGKGQLSSACRELNRLGLHELPIIGLAKEFEEIYRPGRPVPVRLPEDSPALRLLQRIRDEAHRFANGYHQLLMKRRIAESILDDCPGVSQARKQALLTRFGSVARLRRADAATIAQTPGISKRLAGEIVEFLAKRA